MNSLLKSVLVNRNHHLLEAISKLRSESISVILIRGTIGAFVVSIFGHALTLGLNVLLARTMGVEHYGVYTYGLTWIMMMTLPAMLGFDTTLVRYVAAYQAQNAWGLFRGILRRSNQISLAISLFIGGLGMVIVWILRRRLGPELAVTMWIGWLILPLLALNGLRQAALRSLRHIVLSRLPESTLRPLFLAVLVSLLYLAFNHPIQAPMVVSLTGLAVVVAFFIGSYWLRRKLPAPVSTVTPEYHDREWISVAWSLFLVSGTMLIVKQIDPIMLGAFCGTTEVGIYSAANRWATVTTFGLNAVNIIVAPMISRLYVQGKLKELQRMVTLGAYGILAFTLPISLVLVVGGKFLLTWFGPEFTSGYAALVILIVGQLVNALAGPVGFLMIMTDHQRAAARLIIISLVLNIVLDVALIPLFGIEGAALAATLTNVFWNIAMLIYVRRRLQITPTVFASVRRTI